MLKIPCGREGSHVTLPMLALPPGSHGLGRNTVVSYDLEENESGTIQDVPKVIQAGGSRIWFKL